MSWLDKKSILALAPMADLTDGPFCRICREVANTPRPDVTSGHPSQEGNFVIFREMVSAEAIVRGNKKTLKMCEFEPIEKPIVLQLFGSKPEVMARAGEILANTPPTPLNRGELLRLDGIDVNMGCPVPKIAGKGRSGAFLMKDHETAVEIVKALKRANLGVPVSVKTRLGWSKNSEILDFAPKLEQAGADAITIHGRTKTQGYSGKADWEMIGRAKKRVKIPIIANGDINSAEDVDRCLEVTGADGVMIGRGALGNPWIFQSFPPPTRGRLGGGLALGETPPSPSPCRGGKISLQEIKRVVMRHAELHLERYGGEHGLKTFRKHLLYYFKNFPNARELRRELVKVSDLRGLKEIFYL